MDCSICCEAITDATGKIQLSCSHIYHVSCATKWFAEKASNGLPETCPMCRHQISDLEEIPKNILITYEFLAGTREELHSLLKRFGGRGISNTMWKFLISNKRIAHKNAGQETNLIMNLSEMAMLMTTNGCKKELTFNQWYSLYNDDDWDLVNP